MSEEKEKKSIWLSKTIWINALMAIPGVLTFVMENDMFPVDPELYVTLMLAVNFILRMVTKKPIKVGIKKKLNFLKRNKKSDSQSR